MNRYAQRGMKRAGHASPDSIFRARKLLVPDHAEKEERTGSARKMAYLRRGVRQAFAVAAEVEKSETSVKENKAFVLAPVIALDAQRLQLPGLQTRLN